MRLSTWIDFQAHFAISGYVALLFLPPLALHGVQGGEDRNDTVFPGANMVCSFSRPSTVLAYCLRQLAYFHESRQ